MTPSATYSEVYACSEGRCCVPSGSATERKELCCSGEASPDPDSAILLCDEEDIGAEAADEGPTPVDEDAAEPNDDDAAEPDDDDAAEPDDDSTVADPAKAGPGCAGSSGGVDGPLWAMFSFDRVGRERREGAAGDAHALSC